MNEHMNSFIGAVKELTNGLGSALANIGANTINVIMIVVGYCVFLPAQLALLTGLTDKTPGLDSVALVQLMLLLSFCRSIIQKDTVATIIHALGWFGQSLLLAMILFK